MQVECNTYECSWDGTDCSLGLLPWDNCTTETVNCWDAFQDDICDEQCNSELCLFDGFDCQPSIDACSSRHELYCTDYYDDGHCDNGCNNAECGWDGLDCVDYPPRYAAGELVLTVLVEPEVIRNNTKKFLREIGHVLRTVVIFSQDDDGNDKILPWSGYMGPVTDSWSGQVEVVTESSPTVNEIPSSTTESMKSTQISVSTVSQSDDTKKETLSGSTVYLRIDNSKCYQSGGQCFETSDQAASFLAARSSKGTLDLAGFAVQSVDSEADSPSDEGPSSNLPWIIAVAVIAIALMPVIGVLISAARKRKAYGKTWFPENFTGIIKRTKKDGQDSRQSSTGGKVSVSLKRFEGVLNGSATFVGVNESRATTIDAKRTTSRDNTFTSSAGNVRKKIKFQEPSPSSSNGDDAISLPDDSSKTHWYQKHDSQDFHLPLSLALTPPQDDDGYEQFELDLQGGGTLISSQSNYHDRGDGDIGDGDTAIITDLLAKGACSSATTTGETQLHIAARYARADAAKSLLNEGADVNAPDITGRTPLHTAIAADALGVLQVKLENVVEELISGGADLNTVDKSGKSALHWAAAVNNIEATTVLLKRGVTKDTQDDKGETPIFLASKEGSYETAKTLLDHLANREITDHMDRSPLDIAKERCHSDIIKLLEEYNIGESPPLILTMTTNGSPHQIHQGNFLPISTNQPKKRKAKSQEADFIHDDLDLSIYGISRYAPIINSKTPPSCSYNDPGFSIGAHSQQHPLSLQHRMDSTDTLTALSSENSLGSPPCLDSSPASSLYGNHSFLSHPNITEHDIPASNHLAGGSPSCSYFEDTNHIITVPRVSNPRPLYDQEHHGGMVLSGNGLQLDMGIKAPVSVPQNWMRSVQSRDRKTTPPGQQNNFHQSFDDWSPNTPMDSPVAENNLFTTSPSQIAAFQALARSNQQSAHTDLASVQEDFYSDCMLANYSVACT
ncbi:neurogenic locus notch homolog protein 1-like [Glandiceps talaboti]